MAAAHGVHRQDPEAVARAKAAKAAGIVIYTVGLGKDSDVAALETMARGADY